MSRRYLRRLNRRYKCYSSDPKMDLPNYKNFSYELTEEEKDIFGNMSVWHVKDRKYIQSLANDQLDAVYRSMALYGGKQRGAFVKLKKKMKMNDYLDPLIVSRLVVDEEYRRNSIGDIAHERDIAQIERKEKEKYI